LNLVGIREAARVQLVLVVGLFGLMSLYVIRGLPAVSVQRFEPFAPRGAGAVLATAGFVFVSYGGLLKIASVAEELRTPGRTIPGGMILSLLVTGAMYVLMVTVTVGVLPADHLDGSLTPIADGALVFMGRGGQIALGVAAAMAFLTTANAGILTGSRYLLAMSRDGMLPKRLARIGSRFQTPHAAILVTGCLVILPVFVDLYILVEAASVGLILTNILASLSLIALRESRLQNYRPKFRAPLYPWVQIAGILGFLFILFEMGVEAYTISALLVVVGFCLYWFYGRARVQRESALLHLIQRVTARELVTGTLETELKQVIRERDEIVLDRFDHLIERAAVIDMAESMPAEELFAWAADKLSVRLNVDRQPLLEALRARELESSTVISPGLAVPHVVIEGRGLFDILLARSRRGFVFGPGHPHVHCVFMLVGTSDGRNFHLRALAAIAQIVQEQDFEQKWLSARGEQGLRDLVLLGERRRHGS
jgi:APA family basic amino acid/polyamine antiporter